MKIQMKNYLHQNNSAKDAPSPWMVGAPKVVRRKKSCPEKQQPLIKRSQTGTLAGRFYDRPPNDKTASKLLFSFFGFKEFSLRLPKTKKVKKKKKLWALFQIETDSLQFAFSEKFLSFFFLFSKELDCPNQCKEEQFRVPRKDNSNVFLNPKT